MAERSLPDSLALLLAPYTDHRDPVLAVVPKTGEIMWVNNAARTFYGKTPEPVDSFFYDSLVRNPTGAAHSFEMACDRKQSSFRQVHKTAAGQWATVTIYCVPFFWDDGEGVLVFVQDNTSLEEAVNALHDGHQFLHTMMDNAPSSIFAKDVDGRYLFVNARFTEHAARPAHQILARTAQEIFPREMALEFTRSDDKVMASGKPVYEELSFLNEGEMEYWSSTKFPLRNQDGAILGLCGILLNVTEWRTAQTALRQMARAIEQSPVSVVMTDTHGRIISVNPHFTRISGYSEAEVIGRSLDFMLAEEEDVFEAAWELLREGKPWQGEVRHKTRDGALLWEHCSLSAVRDHNDTIVNFVLVKDDITERKRMEQHERDMERIVRHDLKSPLMSFVWVPRSLRKEANITPEQTELLRDMEDSAQRMLRMINLSRDLFKMEEGCYDFEPEDINILRVLNNVLRDLQSSLDIQHLTVDVRIDGSPADLSGILLVSGEEILCHAIMSNLLKNALESSAKGDVITVDFHQNGMTTMAVHNSQPVPADIRETFFEKYSTSGKRFGTGLGTYSAKLMVETQRGTIAMESTPEKGTTVTVTLPSTLGHP